MLVAATGAAGNVPGALPGFGAAPVMTGAPIPDGADAVVPVEGAEPQAVLGPGHTVRVPAERFTGRFVRRAAESSEFLHVAMQPDGPQGLATVGGIPVVCFPGNPVSSWMSAEMLLWSCAYWSERPAAAAVSPGAV